jgi:hypothetical protein
MPNINVNDLIDLNLAGADLFNDPESFMEDLNEESEQVIGGDKITEICRQPTCLHSHKHCIRYTERLSGTYGDIFI